MFHIHLNYVKYNKKSRLRNILHMKKSHKNLNKIEELRFNIRVI